MSVSPSTKMSEEATPVAPLPPPPSQPATIQEAQRGETTLRSLADELRDLNVHFAVESIKQNGDEPEHQNKLSPNQLDSALARIGFKSRIEQTIRELNVSKDGVISKESFTEMFSNLRANSFEMRELAGRTDPIMSYALNTTDSDRQLKESMFSEQLARYAEDLMTLADANGDGKLTVTELTTFLDDRDKQLRQMFLSIDTNNNGFIEPEEFVAALHKSGLRLSSNDLILLWERMADTTAFGPDSNRKLNYDQFRHFLFLIPFKEPSLHALFRTLEEYNLQIQDLDLLPVPVPHFETLSKIERRRYFVAGGVAGLVGRTLTAPMDRMRVYLQNETQEVFSKSELKKAAAGSSKTSIKSTTTHFLHGVELIYKTRGIKEFWRGNGIECLRVFPAAAAQFFTVEYVKGLFRILEGGKSRSDISHVARFIAGASGGMATVITTFPFSTIKVRMMSAVEGEAVAHDHHHSTPLDKKDVSKGKRHYSTYKINNMMDPMYGKRFNSTTATSQEYQAWPAIKALYRQEGIRGFYRGLGVSLAGIAPFAGFNYAIFEAFKQRALRNPDLVRVDQLRVFYYGLTSASIATAICYPFQIIKTRMQAQGTPAHPEIYKNTLDCVKKLIKNEGWHGFFKGMGATFGRTLPAAVITRLAYEQNKAWLGVP